MNENNEIESLSLDCEPRLNCLLLGVKDLISTVFISRF